MTDDTCAAILSRYECGGLSPQLALMELLIASEDDRRVELLLEHAAREHPTERYRLLHTTFVQHRAGCAQLAAILRAEQPSSDRSGSLAQRLQHWQQLFDGLVEQSEELSVAFYSLGSPEVLALASEEIVALLVARGLLAPHVRVLDLGCGIGRFEPLIAPWVREIAGCDLSPKMVAAARRRCAGLANVNIRRIDGRDLSPFADASQELVLAIDSFPYLVAAGPSLVETMLREIARVLVVGGRLALFNFSYREQLERDRAELTELAARHGFWIEVRGEQPFRLWNGHFFLLRRYARRGSE